MFTKYFSLLRSQRHSHIFLVNSRSFLFLLFFQSWRREHHRCIGWRLSLMGILWLEGQEEEDVRSIGGEHSLRPSSFHACQSKKCDPEGRLHFPPQICLPICQSTWGNCVLMKEPLGYDSEDNAGVGPGSGVGCVTPDIGFHGAFSCSFVLICMYPCKHWFHKHTW